MNKIIGRSSLKSRQIDEDLTRKLSSKNSLFHTATAQISLHTNLAASHCFTVYHGSQLQISLIAEKIIYCKKVSAVKKEKKLPLQFVFLHSRKNPARTPPWFYNKTYSPNGLKRESGPPKFGLDPHYRKDLEHESDMNESGILSY